jgi:prepilin-type processing-associated H-X9-DG protein
LGRVIDGAVQVFLAPSEDSRKVLEEILPVVSGQRIQVPDHAITKGLQWAALGLDWPPRLALRVHIQSTDPGAAQALRQFLAQALVSMTQALGLKTADPKQGNAFAGLIPEVVDNTLRVSLDAQQATRLLDEVIAPALVEVHRWSVKMQCGTALSGLGKAMILYASDHNDLLPPDLQILIKASEIPPRMLQCEGEGMGRSAMPYVYRGVDLGGTSANVGLILVHDPRGSHHDGRNVLFVDSHVEWLTEGEFQKRIEEDNRLRRRAGLPEKPAE